MFKILATFIWFTLFGASTRAQQKDSLETMLRFIMIGSSYQQQPLHLVMEYTSTSNIILDAGDTAHLRAEFYLQPHGSYMHFGEIEEIVNDSLALLVSENIQCMILYKNAKEVLTQIRSSMGMQIPKASVLEWCKKFEAYKRSDTGKDYIDLIGRSKIYGTSLPKEEMKILYNRENLPIEISNIKRKLLPVDETAYAVYKSHPAFSDKTILADAQHYIIKEQIIQFKYLSIDHLVTELPVVMENRITKNKDLNDHTYVPVKGFEKFELTEE